MSVWQNPFEKTLVEEWFLENIPENYQKMVACFYRPDFMEKLEMIDIKPKILMGGRGTGKTQILRMLTVQSIISKIKISKEKDDKIDLEEYKEKFFGIYLKSNVFNHLKKYLVNFIPFEQLF